MPLVTEVLNELLYLHLLCPGAPVVQWVRLVLISISYWLLLPRL